jgi:AcrR family transcriptional regulator
MGLPKLQRSDGVVVQAPAFALQGKRCYGLPVHARNLQSRDERIPADARQLRSRKALAGALLELLERMPFDLVTIREITARAGTGYATYFRHYPDKEALLGDVAAGEIANLLALATPILFEASSAESARALCRHVEAHKALWSALLTGGAGSILRTEFIRQARELSRPMPPPADSWLPADLAVVHGAGATIDLLAWWLAQDENYSAEQIAEILNQLIIAPLVRDLPRAFTDE